MWASSPGNASLVNSISWGLPSLGVLVSSGPFELGLCHANRHYVHITNHLQDHLTDFELLAQSIATHPTHFAELVPDYPSAIGSVDAAKSGMGGVLFAESKPPLLWCAPFPSDIQACIISTKNPTGDIMNSDLEQAG